MTFTKAFVSLAILWLSLVFPEAKAQDLTITSAPSLVSGCNLPCSQSITVTIYNIGPFGVFATPVTVSYSVNGGAVISETFTLVSLPAGAVYTYTFNPLNNANICPAGTYIFDFDVDMTGDLNTANDQYSITIVNDTTVVGGTLFASSTSTADTVCASANSGVITLLGNTGYIDYWMTSVDGGTTWTTYPDDSLNVFSYSNLDSTTIYMVYIDGGLCPDGSSPWATVFVDQPTDPGFLVGNATVCSTGNSGTLNLTGYTGDILNWNYSTDAGITWIPIVNDTNFYNYTNLTATTIFTATIQNGVCPSGNSAIATITVTSPPVPGAVSSDITVCSGTNTGSLALLGYSGTIDYWLSSTDGGVTWTPISNTTASQNYSGLTQTTIYTVVLQNGVCPADTAVAATVTVSPPPVANAGSDTIIYLGDTVCFNGTGGFFYSWSPATMLTDPGIQNPCLISDTTGTFTYTLTVTDPLGCTDTDVLLVTILDTATTTPPIDTSKIPNLIICNFMTPNGDGDNDVWNIIDIEYYLDNEVTILNKNGQILFKQEAYNNTWGGEGIPDGSYYYIVKINALDKTFKGVLTVASTK